MIESYKTDTLKDKDRYNLIKKYGLTQFDSGAYTIPRQKIIVGDIRIDVSSFSSTVSQNIGIPTSYGFVNVVNINANVSPITCHDIGGY